MGGRRDLGVPLGAANFLFLLGSGGQVPGSGLDSNPVAGGLAGTGRGGDGERGFRRWQQDGLHPFSP